MKSAKVIYIAGPMSGIEEYNFPAFDMAEADLLAKGWIVINPAQMDRDIGFDPLIDVADVDFLHAAMVRDTNAIIHQADALAMLPGWENSKGARGEMGLAVWKHIPVYLWPDMTLIQTEKAECNSVKKPILPQDAQARKRTPIASGVLDYFPKALAAVAQCSYAGNEQHNPGQPLHWDRSKSTDEADCLIRHFIERGTIDSDGIRHSAKMAWRGLALLEKEIEAK
jgi:hypothetical protein